MAAEAIDFAVVDRDVVIVGDFAEDEGMLAIATIGTVVVADGAIVEVEEGVSEIGGVKLELTIWRDLLTAIAAEKAAFPGCLIVILHVPIARGIS